MQKISHRYGLPFRNADGARSASWGTYAAALRRDARHLGFDIDSPSLVVDLNYLIASDGKLTERGQELWRALRACLSSFWPGLVGVAAATGFSWSGHTT